MEILPTINAIIDKLMELDLGAIAYVKGSGRYYLQDTQSDFRLVEPTKLDITEEQLKEIPELLLYMPIDIGVITVDGFLGYIEQDLSVSLIHKDEFGDLTTGSLVDMAMVSDFNIDKEYGFKTDRYLEKPIEDLNELDIKYLKNDLQKLATICNDRLYKVIDFTVVEVPEGKLEIITTYSHPLDRDSISLITDSEEELICRHTTLIKE